jgi:hypothetical protein
LVGTFTKKKIKLAAATILDFSKIRKSKLITLGGAETLTKFRIDWSNSLKVSRLQKSKMAAGLRPPSWILVYYIIDLLSFLKS